MGEAKKALVVLTEPPPTSSGLGTAWAKIALGAESPVLRFDFLGPDPALCSNHGDSGLRPGGELIGLGTPPFARRSSLRRSESRGLRRWLWSGLRAPFAAVERATGRNLYDEWINESAGRKLPRVLRDGCYDLVVAMAPTLELVEVVESVARAAGIPFGFAVGDPIGARDGAGGFQAREHSRQQTLIDRAAAFVTTEAAFERYFREAFEVESERLVFFQDAFLPVGSVDEVVPEVPLESDELLHWGQISPWRPIDTLVDAIGRWNRGDRPVEARPLRLTVMGGVVDRRSRSQAEGVLGERFRTIAARPYLEARAVARTARRFVVVVSPRHRDNVPAKLIDALAYEQPILLLAHPDSAAREVVTRLGVGVVADIRDAGAVHGGIVALERDRETLREAFRRPEVGRSWNYSVAGERFRKDLARAMRWW